MKYANGHGKNWREGNKRTGSITNQMHSTFSESGNSTAFVDTNTQWAFDPAGGSWHASGTQASDGGSVSGQYQYDSEGDYSNGSSVGSVVTESFAYTFGRELDVATDASGTTTVSGSGSGGGGASGSVVGGGIYLPDAFFSGIQTFGQNHQYNYSEQWTQNYGPGTSSFGGQNNQSASKFLGVLLPDYQGGYFTPPGGESSVSASATSSSPGFGDFSGSGISDSNAPGFAFDSDSAGFGYGAPPASSPAGTPPGGAVAPGGNASAPSAPSASPRGSSSPDPAPNPLPPQVQSQLDNIRDLEARRDFDKSQGGSNQDYFNQLIKQAKQDFLSIGAPSIGDYAQAALQGAAQGAKGGLSNTTNILTYGGSDYVGLTDSSQYQSKDYASGKVFAVIGREALVNAAALGGLNALSKLRAARVAVEAAEEGGEATVEAAESAGSNLSSSFEEFAEGRTFSSEAEAQKAWEAYQQAANAENGLVIGHGSAPIDNAFNGWQALRTTNWTPAINQAWIDGAIDAGLPIKLVTPFENLTMVNPLTGELTVTWQEILQIISRGGQLIGG